MQSFSEFQNDNNQYVQMVNYIILMAKWYINKNKEQNKPLYLIELLGIFKNKINMIIFMNT